MLKRRKELISRLLVLSICISFVPTTAAFADQATNQGTSQSITAEADFTFDASRGEITRYNGNDTTVVIPSTIGGVPVNGIYTYAFQGRSSITSITISDGIKYINDGVFENCSSLKSIILPDSLGYIGKKAFKNCSSLTSVMLPNNLSSISESTFENCSSLASVALSSNLTSIGFSAFNGCSSLVSVALPKNLTSTSAYAFMGCSSLENITVDANNQNYISIDGVLFDKSKTKLIIYPGGKKNKDYIIPDGIQSVENYAFGGCSNLTSIIIPDSVISIGNGAFSDCRNLPSITIPDSVTSMGNSAFIDCSLLTDITISNNIKTIDYYTFKNCSSLTRITIPGGATSIQTSAFEGCSGLTSIVISDGVRTIGEYAFTDCTGLTSITFPNSVTSIARSAFNGCSDLTKIIFSNSLTSIGGSAFAYCTELTSITIPDSVTSIEDYAFEGCNGLTRVIIPDNVTSIKTGAFNSSYKTLFYVESEKTKNLLMNIGIKESKIVLNGQIPVKVTSLSLSRYDLKYKIGDSKTLGVTISPSDASDETVTWSSSDNKVATVNEDGEVKAVGVGSATITCTTNDGSGISAACNITVSGQNDTGGTIPTNVKVTGITVNGNSSISTKEATVTLAASILPSNATNKTVIWTSSDTNIATVDSNGVVTAKANGNVTITATANDGSGVNQAKTITISGQSATGGTSGTTPTEVKVTGITISGNSDISVKGGTITLTPNILPSTASNKTVTWTSSNPSVATVSDQGVVTAISNGSAIITATAADGSKIAGTKVITVTGQTTTTNNSSDSVLQSVSISGTEEVGHTLKAKVKYNGTKPELQYQWQRASKKDGDYTDISGADEEEYKLKSSDRNKYIKVIVSSTINGTTYNVGDITSKIDRDTSDDDDEDNDSSNSNSSSSSNTYNNSNDIGILSLPNTTNKSPNSVGYNASTTNSSSPANGVFTNPAGHPISGWVSSNDKWYYLDNSGHAQVGWVNDNGKWYYFNTSGDSNRAAMKTGWVQDNGKWYYLDQSGAMVSNTTIDGYRLGKDGAMI